MCLRLGERTATLLLRIVRREIIMGYADRSPEDRDALGRVEADIDQQLKMRRVELKVLSMGPYQQPDPETPPVPPDGSEKSSAVHNTGQDASSTSTERE